VQKTDDVTLFELEAQLVGVLAKEELDEGILRYYQVLSLLRLVEDGREVRH
jgi:hypothetical protein